MKRIQKGIYKTFDEKYSIVKLDKKQNGKWGIYIFKDFPAGSMYAPLCLNIETLELAKQALKKYIQENDPYYPTSSF